MRMIVTGAGGFVGRALVALLAPDHDVVATDLHLPEGAVGTAGDLSDPATLEALFAEPCDAVVHLATFPGGASEDDPAHGWQVNVAATCALAEAAAQHRPRFVYASSIAVLGDVGHLRHVDDETPLAPTMLYGAHKAIVETWLATMVRRGQLSALSLRLPGLVARPSDGAGLKSAYLSALFHAVAAGRPIDLPVSSTAASWLMSAKQAAWNLRHALTVPDHALPPSRVLTLPALHISMDKLVAAIGDAHGIELRVRYTPEPDIEGLFGSYPPLQAQLADALGFASDATLESLIRGALETHS
jgi:D-erythronate 2-dehydrogenase